MTIKNAVVSDKPEEIPAIPAPVLHEFNLEEYYMFYWRHGAVGPTVIVGTPTSIETDSVLFHFAQGFKSESRWVPKTEILAVGDLEKGTLEVKGWGGKYRILNQALVDTYIDEKVIELKD